MTEQDWNELLSAVKEIQEWFPNGVTYIGGIAVYAHMIHDETTSGYGAKSHDADFVILIPDFADLRDIEAVTPNRRLGKHQFVKNGFEFDVYVEGQTNLCVPVPEIVSESMIRSGLQVACPEHLLALKSKALMDRKGSAKGDKDEDDIVRILLSSDGLNVDLLARMTDEMTSATVTAARGDAVMRLSKGNSHAAKGLRERIAPRIDELVDRLQPSARPR